jgi:hypothetical protein
VHGDPAGHQHDVAGVQPGADRQAQAMHAVADGQGAAARAGRAVEGGEEPVPAGVDLPPAEPGQLLAHHPVMPACQGAVTFHDGDSGQGAPLIAE